jgi:HPr kinase/phosphorylase
MDVFGIGVLLLGKSGIGKSECALELVLRGHRLVADDVVRCDWRPPGVVFGSAANLLRHHIEARGLGVLNVKELFGVTSVRDRKSIDVVVRLVEWDDAAHYDRLGVEDTFHTILETKVRELTVPVRPGRDMGAILEVAARNELLRRTGSNAAKNFMGRLEQQLLVGTGPAAGDSSFEPLKPPATASEEPTRGPAPDPLGEPKPRKETPRPMPQSSESSAWIPAVRPREEEP